MSWVPSGGGLQHSGLSGEGEPGWCPDSAGPWLFSLPGRNALVCSHDHLTLFLTLVSGLEFIRFDLDLVRRLGSGYWREARGSKDFMF